MNMPDTKGTLLFVDDEERILRTLEMAFRHHYRVLTTTDGQEALRLLRTESIDVIVSDQRMPIMTGVEVLRGARDIAPSALRILLTGYSELAGIVGSINDGEIFRYVQKPWQLQELREILAEAVDISRSTRESTQQDPTLQESAQKPEDTNNPEGHIVVLHTKPGMAQFIRQEKPALQIHPANNLDAALALLAQHPQALLVTDLMLPEGDISDGLAMLKLRRPELVVIVVTAFSDTAHLIRLINRAQVYRVLPVPLSRKMLLNSLESGLLHQRRMSTNPSLRRRHQVVPQNANTQDSDKLSNNSIVNRVKSYLEKLRA